MRRLIKKSKIQRYQLSDEVAEIFEKWRRGEINELVDALKICTCIILVHMLYRGRGIIVSFKLQIMINIKNYEKLDDEELLD